MGLGLAAYLLITTLISVWNAFVVGAVWADRRAMGWAMQVLIWSTAVMAFCGFLWVNVILESFFIQYAQEHHWKGKNWHWIYSLPPHTPTALMSLGYLVIIIPIIGSGTVMSIWSVVVFRRNRSFANGAGAFYNNGANLYNIYEATRAVPHALSSVANAFSGGNSSSSSNSNSRNGGGWIILVIFLIAVAVALFETIGIIMLVSHMHTRRMHAKLMENPRYASDRSNHAVRTTW